jgi:hypothetical protein
MSPLDIAAFAAPISFIIAIFSGLSGMAVDAVTDLAIFSLVQLIMAAEAGAAAMEGAKRVVTAKIRRFIQNNAVTRAVSHSDGCRLTRASAPRPAFA